MVDRPLSVIESHFAQTSALGQVTLCGCEVTGPLSIDLIKLALEALRRRHPLLRCAVLTRPCP